MECATHSIGMCTTTNIHYHLHIKSMIPVDGEARYLECLNMNNMDITNISANIDPVRSTCVWYAGCSTKRNTILLLYKLVSFCYVTIEISN